MEFDFATLPREARGKLLHSTIVPRPIAWVVTRHAEGAANAAPFSFFNVVSTEPPLLCIGMAARTGEDKDTLANIRRSGQFVVNLVPIEMAEAMNQTSTEFGPEVDELARFGLATLPSTKVDPPRVAGSPVAMECETFSLVELDQGGAVVLGRVLAMHVAEAVLLDATRHYVDTPSLGLIGRMHGGGWYARTTDLFEMPRPPKPPR
ncbi:MAG TPA: flavin reductase family protein [Falsiroseomonas sp.]|jgi:flavin reductase (DIM6/NTAB) family NADH-FMN oxidoreductase RutF|nr:flavin reductase family protein [Falsiroseomonas sp.]